MKLKFKITDVIVLVSTHMLWPINRKEDIDVEITFTVYMVGKRKVYLQLC
jgi:hypothetical protein